MEIRHGNYRVTTDKYQWMFQKSTGFTTDKNGVEREGWDTWGYYSTLDQLIDATSERLLRRADGSAEDAIRDIVLILKPLLADIRDAQAALKEMVA